MGYFKDKHQRLVIDWLTADTKQQYFIYKKLSPTISNMAEIIGRRYFSVPFARQQEYEKDVVQHVFLNLNHYCPPASAYSYIGTMIRNWYMDRMNVKKFKKHKKVEVEFLDDYGEMQPIEYLKPEMDIEGILMHLKTLRKKVEQDIVQRRIRVENADNLSAHKMRESYFKMERKLLVVNLIIDYVIKFEDFHIYSVFDYVRNNCEINNGTLSSYFYDLLGFHIKIRKDEVPSTRDMKEYSILNDDYCPIDNPKIVYRKRKINSGIEFDYF